MKVEGGCYCGDVRYRAEGEPLFRAECYCRECQYITGGGYLTAMAMPAEGFAMVQGKVKGYAKPDVDRAVTREFCGTCGTHLFTRAPGFEKGVIIKVGTLDNPADFGKADSANFCCDAQPFHRLPDDMPNNQKWMR